MTHRRLAQLAVLAAATLTLTPTGVYAGWQNQGRHTDNRVLLQDVEALTLRSGEYTTGRRSSPVPQLKCMGTYCAHKPDTVRCVNSGSDGNDVQWECKADLGSDYKFGSMDVICEGYDYPDDPYILKGSCGLEYTLDLTEEGKRRNSGQHSWTGSNYNRVGSGYSDYLNTDSYYSSTSNGFGLGSLLWYAVALGAIYMTWPLFLSKIALGYLLFSTFFGSNIIGSLFGPILFFGAMVWFLRTLTSGVVDGSGFTPGYGAPGYGGMGGWGWGNGFGWGNGWGWPRYGSSGYGYGSYGNDFWRGAGLGGLMGYAAGSYNRPTYRAGGWGGGPMASSYYGPSTPSMGGGSTSREATGYAGTRRR